MESFFRYISYVDYYKQGEKIKNVGFLRWKLHNSRHHVEIQLKGVSGSQGSFKVQEKNTGKIIGEIEIDKGIGSFIKKFPSMTASGEMYIDTYDDRLYVDDIEGFIIRLNPSDYLSVPVRLKQEKKARGFSEITEKDSEDTLSMPREKKEAESQIQISIESSIEEQIESYEKCNKQKVINERNSENEESLIYKKKHTEEQTSDNKKETNIQDTKAASENVLIEGIGEKYIQPDYMEERKEEIQDKKIKIIEPIHEDKWQQLCKEYQNVHPFPDRKVFLSIKPEDFIILQQGYQKLVHNSFLLHGFYNYGHMILGKLAEEKEAPIYIGVPGVYYEREKQAAQMFGFVGFESAEHPVQAGSYGYYMIEVEI